MVRLGQFDGHWHFAITTRCPGQTLEEMAEIDARRVVSNLFETLDVIRGIDVSGFRGWGLTDASGNGLFPSWPNYLLSQYNQKFDQQWTELARQTFLEKEVYETFFREMEQLLPYCPAEKYLVHGDFGFDNVVSDGQRITGVLDWAECRLGDYVYDIAYLDFWSRQIPYGNLWYDYATARGYDVPHFTERMRCYMLNISLGSLVIAAAQEDEWDYIRVRERTYSVLQQPGRRSPDWMQ
jgi:hygromycin-B 4-O-kinase